MFTLIFKLKVKRVNRTIKSDFLIYFLYVQGSAAGGKLSVVTVAFLTDFWACTGEINPPGNLPKVLFGAVTETPLSVQEPLLAALQLNCGAPDATHQNPSSDLCKNNFFFFFAGLIKVLKFSEL